jgi:hypothetical protein
MPMPIHRSLLGHALLATGMATINLEWVWDTKERGLAMWSLKDDKPMSFSYR